MKNRAMNENTTVSFSTPVTVEGQPLAAGSYSLFLVPGREKWTVVLNRFTGGDEQAKASFVATVPANRTGTSEEIAQTIVFIASAKAPFMIGTSIVVDGGKLAS